MTGSATLAFPGGSSSMHSGVASSSLPARGGFTASRSAFQPPSSIRSAVPQIQLFPQQYNTHQSASLDDDAASDTASLHTAVSRPESFYEREARTGKTKKTKRSTNMLRQLTVYAKDNFASWEVEGGADKSKLSGSRRQRQATSERHQQQQQESSSSSSTAQHQLPAADDDDKPKGFLQAALEGGNAPSTATKEKAPAAKCLTTPSEPISNNRKDNAEGNLIVYEGDVFLPSQVQSVWSKSASSSTSSTTTASQQFVQNNTNYKNHGWKVLGLLGQGTFAQVFECQHLETKERVAIKVVKNKTAYTRQAAVEIDVFQALHQQQQQQQQQTTTMSSTASVGGAPASDSSGGGVKNNNTGNNNNRDTMVHLECYFMYQQHLCLVFELLGLNLYEVLKKRQFRGLSLRVVRAYMKQAMDGIKLLSQKQIVHCDLKPENILLVTDDDGEEEETPSNKSKQGDAPTRRRGVDLSFESQATAEKINSKPNINPKESTTTSFATTTTTGSTSSSSSSGDGSGGNKSRNTTSTSSTMKAPSTTNPGATNGTPMTQDSGLSFDGCYDPNSETSFSRNLSSRDQQQQQRADPRIKLIDFGSACFEGHTAHTYIQSRFYRSPEVLIGLPYDSSIDMWSLGCVAAELFLGLPILPGVHEHDQIGRICEMIGTLPDWMLDQGSKASKYFIKQFSRTEGGGGGVVSSSSGSGAATTTGPGNTTTSTTITPPPRTPSPSSVSAGTAPPRPTWRIKTQSEYVQSLSTSEIRKKGGLAKLEKQNTNRYFKRKKLGDIIKLHGHQKEDREQLGLFIHFLIGILEPDPWKRWTAFQASQHPFITGSPLHPRRQQQQQQQDIASSVTGDESLTASSTSTDKKSSSSSSSFDIYWVPPWDPSVCRRKLLNVQKTREKQQALRRSYGTTAGNSSSSRSSSAPTHHGAGGSALVGDPSSPDKITSRKMMEEPPSPAVSQASTGTSRVTAMTDAMSLSRQSGAAVYSQSGGTAASSPLPPSSFVVSSGATSSATGTSSSVHQSAPHTLAGSLGSGIVGRSVHPGSAASTAYMASSSLTDYHQQAAAAAAHHPSLMMASPHMHGVSYGDVAAAGQHGSMMMAPQSYQGSVGSYSGLQQAPLDADFGYALQRPGVVPGVGSLSSSYTMNQAPPPAGGTSTTTSASGGPMAFSPHHHLQSHGRASSYSSGTARSSRYRRQQFSHPQHGSFRGTATASIQEDAADSKSSSVTSGTSLLAQQLEDAQSVATQGSRAQMMDGSLQLQQQQLQQQQQQMYYMQRIHGHQHLDGQHQPTMAGHMDTSMHLQQHSMPHNYMPTQQMTSYGYYTTTYVTANGTPLQAQSAVDMRAPPVPAAGYSSYGSYNDPMSATYVSPANLHQPQQAALHQQQQQQLGLPPSMQHHQYSMSAAPGYMAQPSMEGLERSHAAGHMQGGPNSQYRGMSM